MAANSGYLEATGLGAISTSYTGFVLQANASDGASVAIPSSGAVWSHLEIIVTAPTTASLDAYISWDTAGNDIAAGPTQASVNVVVLPLSSDRKGCIITLDNIVPRAPGDQDTVGALKLWIKADAVSGSPVLTRCRLHWYLAATRGG